MGKPGFEPGSSGPKPEILTRLYYFPLNKKGFETFINYYFLVGVDSTLPGVAAFSASGDAVLAFSASSAAFSASFFNCSCLDFISEKNDSNSFFFSGEV